jgi:FkbM family methyltransferase
VFQNIKTGVLRTAAKAVDRWLTSRSPGEQIYVLERINQEVLNRLIRAEELRHPSAKRSARLQVLQQFFAREADNLSAADRVELVREAAIRIGVESLSASGPLGVFQGSTRDYGVLARYAAYGAWDPAYQTLLTDHLFAQGRGTLIDIGANIGLTSIPIARERRIICYAFEPEARNFLYLRQNSLANAVESLVNCFNLALYSKEGVLQFELAKGNLGDHRVGSAGSTGEVASRPEGRQEKRRSVEVNATTLDAFFRDKSLESPIVVKCDTQGSEVHVFRGGSEFLKRVDYLIAEFEPYLLDRGGDSVDAYIDSIAQFPYGALQEHPDDLLRARPGGALRLEPIESLIEKMRIFAQSASQSKDYVNLVLARQPGSGSV